MAPKLAGPVAERLQSLTGASKHETEAARKERCSKSRWPRRQVNFVSVYRETSSTELFYNSE